MKMFNNYGCLLYILGITSIILCIAYVYYGIIIKIRDFSEDGEVSLSDCYVIKGYSIDWNERLNFIYIEPRFIKVFDAKNKKWIYASNIYDGIYLFPLIKALNFNMHGFFYC